MTLGSILILNLFAFAIIKYLMRNNSWWKGLVLAYGIRRHVDYDIREEGIWKGYKNHGYTASLVRKQRGYVLLPTTPQLKVSSLGPSVQIHKPHGTVHIQTTISLYQVNRGKVLLEAQHLLSWEDCRFGAATECHLGQKRSPSSDTKPTGGLILNFPISRTVRNTFCCL